MHARSISVFLQVLVASCLGSASATALASNEFAISATDVTMPSSGTGSTKYTVTEIPMTGTLNVSCQYAGSVKDAKVPTCTYGPLHSPVPVNAGQTLTGTIDFYPYGSAIPLDPHRSGRAAAAGLALAGALMLGFGLRRGTRRWLALLLLTFGSMAGMMGISACAGPGTPGTYQYTLTADNESGGLTPLGAAVTTTINVTVP
jgi:hypothetical protein